MLWRPVNRSDGGFTAAELMFVVLVIGILVALAIASYSATTARVNIAACRANRRVLEQAVITYQSANNGSLPATLTVIGDFVRTPDAHTQCPGNPRVQYEYDPVAGSVSCPLHP